MELVHDIWSSLRPYLVKMITDALISALLWVLLWLFKVLTHFFPIEGWAGEVINNIHSMGAVLAFAAFGILFVMDVIRLSNSEPEAH